MKKLIVLLAVIFSVSIALSVIADEMRKIVTEQGTYIEYRQTKTIKDTKGADVEIYAAKTVLFDQALINRQKTQVEQQIANWQEKLAKLDEIQAELDK